MSEDKNKCHLNFTLSKIYEDFGELDKAFHYLSEGNTLRKKILNYSFKQDAELFKKIKMKQPSLLESSLQLKTNTDSHLPIFILGMPRSGTSLVEQIISSHSEVTGAGELNHVAQLGGIFSYIPNIC